MDQSQIVSDPRILVGMPVIAGPRISVKLVVEELAAGMTVEELLTS